MTPEYFSDALQYLDDDLIEQTDALRCGSRPIRRPRVIRWLASAACLVLVMGMGVWFRFGWNTGNKVAFDGAPESFLNDSMNGAALPEKECDCSETMVVQQVVSGAISLYIPENWYYSLESGEDGSYHIVIQNPERSGAIRVGYVPGFGVCGTDLTEEEIRLAGMEALKGTYGQSRYWSFIAFRDQWRDYVIISDGADSWQVEAMTYLDTIEIMP